MSEVLEHSHVATQGPHHVTVRGTNINVATGVMPALIFLLLPPRRPRMDSEAHAEANFSSHSTPEDPEIASSGGAIFSGSQHFTVTGGTFTSVMNVQAVAPAVIPDFRTIPLGDIHLLREIGLKRGSHTTGRQRNRCSVRRVYSARVVGLERNMTVATYQGDGAEEEWWADITRYSWLRHPHFVQLYGFTTSSTIRLQITSNLENFARSIVVIEGISFKIKISAIAEDGPSGYLFLCPESEFHAGVSSFRWPDCPAFWSLDPAGIEHLSPEEATRFGFPTIEPTIEAWGRSWDPTVYAGLRQFHRGKGFDPDSQDIARHLGGPLFRLSRDMEPLSAHVDPDDPGSEEQDNQTTFNLVHDILPLSKTFKFTMNVQLALIVFLIVLSGSIWTKGLHYDD
ncbi:hypothetical protein B0H13DRAFT_2366146 [Mycena leptocephala]|nr:hypothetical protein B0H13DRAFT_2366146 [Mycena leptocephala]